MIRTTHMFISNNQTPEQQTVRKTTHSAIQHRCRFCLTEKGGARTYFGQTKARRAGT